jgi:hypothetical protein
MIRPEPKEPKKRPTAKKPANKEHRNAMAAFWNPRSRVVAQTLLNHHRAKCGEVKPETPITDDVVFGCVLTYEGLRRMAGIGGIAQDMGRHLRKIADWCDMRGFAPLHSLVVRDKEGEPGEGYRR